MATNMKVVYLPAGKRPGWELDDEEMNAEGEEWNSVADRCGHYLSPPKLFSPIVIMTLSLVILQSLKQCKYLHLILNGCVLNGARIQLARSGSPLHSPSSREEPVVANTQS